MEDAHVIVMRDSWGFFGVFDGHGGQQCSSFVARRLTEEISAKPLPEDDAEVKSLMLRIDQEFLDRNEPSGSTGTFAFVEPLTNGDKKVRLRVGNIGDSRVLLGRADGSMVEGPGTDGGLTTDHKPDNEVERERIYRTGGNVETIMGVARVNGDLAVSRAFGDAPHKQTGGPAQEDHPVSVEPEFTSISCDPSDFMMLVCDGISEGNFPNREVVALAAEELKTREPAEAAAAVCRRALERGSMDNLSCMIVLFTGGSAGRKKELLPGPFSSPTHNGFRKAYEAMAERAGLTLAAAVEQRYDAAQKERAGQNSSSEGGGARGAAEEELSAELAHFDAGPPEALAVGSAERTRWFKEWLENREVEPAFDPQNMTRAQLHEMAETDPEMREFLASQGITARTVRVGPEDKLKATMEKHPALKWDDRLKDICGETGKVLQDDPSDGTAQVRFRGTLSATVWLPVECLTDEDVSERTVTVCDEEELRKAVEAIPSLEWKEAMLKLPGQEGIAVKDDPADGTTQVRFPALKISAWLPTSALTDKRTEGDEDGESEDLLVADDMEEDEEPLRTVLVPPVEELKAAYEAHATLRWDEDLAVLCGQQGEVLRDDANDGTSCVRFPEAETTWMPTCVVQKDVNAANGAVEDEGGSPKRQKTS
eukprot:TRINITY_DN50984_c0_g1_i1.p1 TRINITY_DN50984_c0_g1~~TRINITY_DN50984_c0_g1_i1.p1  ORF type:complete len:705 (-),score=163.72 TRINITY_DN50984_c0_g1_i1:53-2008(-)